MTSLTYLPDHVPVFRCASCSLELGKPLLRILKSISPSFLSISNLTSFFLSTGLQDELVSRAFSGARGSAGYLLRSVSAFSSYF